MRIAIVLKFLGFLTLIISAWMTIPFAYAVASRGTDVLPFAESIASGVLVAFLLHRLGRRGDLSKMGRREALAAVALSWVAASAVSGMPYWLHGSVPTYADAFFEAMSGYSTTGSTVLTDIDSLPGGLLLWRALTHWLGGMGIIVLTLTLVPVLGIGGFQLYSAEVPGIRNEKITPRVQQTAAILWMIYLGLTLLVTLLLVMGKMNLFDAVTHAMGTISTGGFSPHNRSLAHFDNAYFDWVITLFMFLSGANFVLHFHALRRRSLKVFFQDPEFCFYLLSVSTLCFLVSLGLYRSGTYGSFAEALRYGAFQVTSLVTTTGFVSADYEVWPYFTKSILFLCLFLGGCAGSTSGAFKQIRLLIILRYAGRQVSRILSPRSVLPLRVGKTSLDLEVVSSCIAFFGLYLMVFAAGIFLITLSEPDLFTAISGVAATLGNVGPGFGSLGASGNFAQQTAGAKWIYSGLMLCGRLELYTVLILFTKAYWREGVILPSPERESEEPVDKGQQTAAEGKR